MKLSKNLSLSEVTKSGQAIRLGIDNSPTTEHLENLKAVAENIFQPIREHFNKPIFVSSGYRSQALNAAIGGAKNSQHSKGEALDLDNDAVESPTNREIFDYIRENLDFDQLIGEAYDKKNNTFAWVHVSYKKDGNNRGEVLIMEKKNGKSTYRPYTEK